jgi:hypothetical protein
MTPTQFLRAGLMVLAAGLVFTAPGFESAARQKAPPPPEVVAPPPPPPAGPVGLPAAMLADAAAYEAFLQRVTAISAGFTDGGSVSNALKIGAAYEPKALVRGAVAYAAIAALESATFVSEVRAAGNTPENRAQMVNDFIANPAYAFSFKGADLAAGMAKEALGGAGLRLYAEGKAVKQSAYDVQHQNWSKAEVVDRSGRLAAVESSSAGPIAPAEDRIPVLQSAASGGQPLPITAQPAQPPYTPLLARALQLAAIAALGEATDSAYDRLTYLTEEGGTHTCLHMAKLNLYQCLAVAKPNYEDIFCMGQHEMMDTGACLARNAGVEMPVDPVPQKASTPPKAPVRAHRSARG